jgi:hypothetical protein
MRHLMYGWSNKVYLDNALYHQILLHHFIKLFIRHVPFTPQQLNVHFLHPSPKEMCVQAQSETDVRLSPHTFVGFSPWLESGSIGIPYSLYCTVGMLLVCVLHIFHINSYYYTFHIRYEKYSL